MKIVNLIGATYQVIDEEGDVIFQGSYADCFAILKKASEK
jgi:hypothetical protein